MTDTNRYKAITGYGEKSGSFFFFLGIKSGKQIGKKHGTPLTGVITFAFPFSVCGYNPPIVGRSTGPHNSPGKRYATGMSKLGVDTHTLGKAAEQKIRN
jgi:hypothetical protein